MFRLAICRDDEFDGRNEFALDNVPVLVYEHAVEEGAVDLSPHVVGSRIVRHFRGRRAGTTAIYTYPSAKSLASIMDGVRTLTRRASHRTLADLLRRLNPVLRGWCTYFEYGVSKRLFSYLDHFAFWRIVGWLKKRHPKLNMGTLIRRHVPGWEYAPKGSSSTAAGTQ